MAVLAGQLDLDGCAQFGDVTVQEYADAMGVSRATALKRFKRWGARREGRSFVLSGDRLPESLRDLISRTRP